MYKHVGIYKRKERYTMHAHLMQVKQKQSMHRPRCVHPTQRKSIFKIPYVQKKTAAHHHRDCEVTSAKDFETAAGRSAIVGVIASVGAELLLPGHPGIVNQLAVELHVPVVVAYFMIVFTAAHDVDRVAKSAPRSQSQSLQSPQDMQFHKIERTTGRACMLIFMFCFMNGVRSAEPGLVGEPGILAQCVAILFSGK